MNYKSEGKFSWNITFTDTEAPILSGTPSTKNVNTDDSLPTAIVSWTPPTASDNSGEAVTLTSDYSPGDAFPIGNTTVTYTATDTYGNIATSSFAVVVTGKYNSQLGFTRSSHYQLFKVMTMRFNTNAVFSTFCVLVTGSDFKRRRWFSYYL